MRSLPLALALVALASGAAIAQGSRFVPRVPAFEPGMVSRLKAPPGFDGLERKSWFVRMPFAENAYERLVSPSGEDGTIAVEPEAQPA